MTDRRGLGRTVAPPRFIAFLVLLPLAAWGWHAAIDADLARSVAFGFDVAAAVFLVSLIPFLGEGGRGPALRRHADANDANRLLVLLVTTLLTIVVMAAISAELPGARKGEAGAIAMLVASLALIWLFANTVYALHYAHHFYSGRGGGGLEFPGTRQPSFTDFAYFAFTLGMTFQTSDVSITSSRLRGVVVLHSFAAFVFNIGVIAFTINVLGGAG
ncbi:MAG: DUF1345 domain-containing protein [Sphingomonadales bacterium]|nr:DUF1345 domain-containing protein [Sphingomonadales bacterium]MDE2567848.1 DUF1345 domain-containing protein [Sphingomonadales bacterium]